MIDFRWEIWDNQTLTVAEESRSNGAMKDLEEDGTTDESLSEHMWLNVQIGTTFATLTSGCLISVITSDSATFASGIKCLGSIGGKTYPLTVAEMVAGAVFSLAFPRWNLHKYLEVYFEPISEAATAGKLDAWFGLAPLSPRKVQKYATGYA
jgi:hypothetical protein